MLLLDACNGRHRAVHNGVVATMGALAITAFCYRTMQPLDLIAQAHILSVVSAL